MYVRVQLIFYVIPILTVGECDAIIHDSLSQNDNLSQKEGANAHQYIFSIAGGKAGQID